MSITPRPAATLILTRDTAAGIEVFLLQRTQAAVFMPGVYVFPGGAVDLADAEAELAAYCGDVDDATASRMLGVDDGGLAWLVAAVRECFEEAGVLLACNGNDELVDQAGLGGAEELTELRRRLAAGDSSLAAMCQSQRLTLAVDRLAPFAHWITPPGPPRRYDTRFFVAVAPAGQSPSHDGEETIDSLWVRPAEALERQRNGELPLASPTIRTLQVLSKFLTTEALMRHARRPRKIVPALPLLANGKEGPRYFVPGDPVYAELSKLDPEGRGDARYEIVPGAVTRLSATVRRLAAPNPSAMTGPGTNTYLVGTTELAVIDPGPADPVHVARIAETGAGRIRWILTTHTHLDHSPAARLLQELTGAEVLGMPAPAQVGQDRDFEPDRVLTDGARLQLPGVTLRAIHTPGHASNHLCYLHEEERLLFSGDHIMQGSTVVISPPDGDMVAYLRSLMALHAEEIDCIAPGHGFLLGSPYEVIDRIVSHRLAREGKVLSALRQCGTASEERLLGLVYGDVPERMHRVAARSLLAHLLKLEAEHKARRHADQWSYAG